MAGRVLLHITRNFRVRGVEYGHHHPIKTHQLEIPKSQKLLGAFFVLRGGNFIPLAKGPKFGTAGI